MSHNFRNLGIWKKSKVLVKDIYITTNSFPNSEIFGLTNQIRRSAVSIPSNIAEGCNLMTSKQLVKHLYIAMGSAGELETQLELASDLGFLPVDNSKQLIIRLTEIQKMIIGFVKKIEKT